MGAPPTPLTPGQPAPLAPGEFTGASQPQVVSFLLKNTTPPSPLYIQRDDTLFVRARSNQTAEILTISARLLLAAEGRVNTINQTLPMPTPYGFFNLSIPLAEGYLLSVMAQTLLATRFGQTFVECVINRGPTTFPLAAPGAVLFMDYVTANSLAGWPGGRQLKGTEGEGVARQISIANPAAGTDWNAIIQTVTQVELISFNAILTTSAVVANRQPQLVITDSVTRYFTGPPNASIVAGTTAQVSGSQGTTVVSVIASDVMVPIPPRNRILGGHFIQVVTAGLQAADQWSAILLHIKEWLEM